MHCHLIVSRKTKPIKEVIPTNQSYDTKNGVIKGGFDRVNLFNRQNRVLISYSTTTANNRNHLTTTIQ